MNKYQKRLHKEVKEFASNKNLEYKIARKVLKFGIKINPFLPCEDCDNCYCTKKKNKIVYCKDNR